MIATTEDRADAFTEETSPAASRPTFSDKPTQKRKVSVPRETLKRLHECVDASNLKQVGDFLLFAIAGTVAVFSWWAGWYPVTALAWLVGGAFGLAKPLTFHDFAHQTMFKAKWKNEVGGVATGTLILVPLTAYRVAHRRHHAYLATEKDPELWPFTSPRYSRTFRVFSAFMETVCGMVYTPLLFFRHVVTADDIKPAEYRRIAWEYALIAAAWGTVLAAIHYFVVWEIFLVGYVAPVAVAGAFQTLNKYVEHLGLHGEDYLANTRNVTHPDPLGSLCSWWMQHVDHHGSHHVYAKIPFENLPEASELIYAQQEPADAPNYASYWSAAWQMAKTLPNPHAGPAWAGRFRH